MDNEKDLLEETENEQDEVLENATEEIVAEEEDSQEVQKADKVIYICSKCDAICENPYCDNCQKDLTEEDAYICKNKNAFEKAKKAKKITVASIAGVAVLAGAVCGGLYWYNQVYNPYNNGEFKDLAFGVTLGQDAKNQDMGYAAYLEINGYKADFPENTYKNIADQYIPLKNIINAELLEGADTTIPEFTATFDINGTFNETSTRGSFEKNIKIKDYFNITDEKDLAQFKEEYGITSDITLETQFKDIRADIYKYLDNNEEITVEDVSDTLYNPYNRGKYSDLAFGTTIGEVAEDFMMQYGYDYDEFLSKNNLPAGMPKSTYEYIAICYIPLGTQASQYGMDVSQFINEAYGLEGTFDENITRGELEASLPLSKAFYLETEEDFAEIKAEYGFDDSVTMDTPFAEVRATIYKKNEADKAAQEAEAAKAELEQTAEDATKEAAETAEVPEVAESAEATPAPETAETAEATEAPEATAAPEVAQPSEQPAAQ